MRRKIMGVIVLSIKSWLVMLCFLLVTGLTLAASATTVIIDEEFSHQNLGMGLEYLKRLSVEDKPAALLEVENWSLSSKTELNFGFSNSVYWVKFKVDNQRPEAKNIVIQIAYPFLDYINLFVVDQETGTFHEYALGDQIPFDERVLAHPNYLVPLTVSGEKSLQVLIRFHTATVARFPIAVWDKERFIEYEYRRGLMLAGFFGLLLAVCAYHCLLAVSVKDMSMVYFALLILGVLAIYARFEGLPAMLFWPSRPWLGDYLMVLGVVVANLGGNLFCVRVLALEESRPVIALVVKIIAGLSIIPVLLMFFVPYVDLLKWCLLLSVVSVVAGAIAYFYRLVDGYPPARYLALAGLCLSGGGAIYALENFAIIPASWFTDTASYMGIALMVLLYSFAISYRVNLDRQLREEAQIKRANELDGLVRERTEALESVNRKLHMASITDSLTQLYNRRHFDQAYTQEYLRACRENVPIAILILDVDHFKSLNDNFGHAFGDLCLQKIADSIQEENSRAGDICARYGGEEFAILLTHTDRKEAKKKAELIRQTIAEKVIQGLDRSVRLTVSIGLASTVPTVGSDQQALLKLADDCLYLAKKNGRNRVEG